MIETFTIQEIMFGQAHGHQFVLGNITIGRVTEKDGTFTCEFLSEGKWCLGVLEGNADVKIRAERIVP